MAYDEGIAEQMREDLNDEAGFTEKKMFGGLAFMLNGHMVCGVHKGGAMYRVGKQNEATALALDGVSPLAFTGKTMSGFLDLHEKGFAEDHIRRKMTELALQNARSLPPKGVK